MNLFLAKDDFTKVSYCNASFLYDIFQKSVKKGTFSTFKLTIGLFI